MNKILSMKQLWKRNLDQSIVVYYSGVTKQNLESKLLHGQKLAVRGTSVTLLSLTSAYYCYLN